FPHICLEVVGMSRSIVRTYQSEGRSRTRHQQSCCPAAPFEGQVACFFEWHFNGAGQAVASAGEGDQPVPLGDGVEDRLSVVGGSISRRSEIFDAAHAIVLAVKEDVCLATSF